jgi:type IV pilus assembly protein PilA
MIGGIRMLKNKKGFTLVELLAVIVILAVILAIAVPSISGVMDSAKQSAFEDNVKLIIKGIDYKSLEAQASGTAGPTAGTYTAADVAAYGANPADYDAFTIVSVGPTSITITGKSTGKFGTCSATNATLSSVTVSGC